MKYCPVCHKKLEDKVELFLATLPRLKKEDKYCVICGNKLKVGEKPVSKTINFKRYYELKCTICGYKEVSFGYPTLRVGMYCPVCGVKLNESNYERESNTT